MDDELSVRVARCLGLPAVTLLPAAGGAGNLSFEVHDPALPESTRSGPIAFLRCKLGDGGLGGLGYTLQREGALLVEAARHGFPVARVLGTFDEPDAILMNVVAGTSRPAPAEIEVVGPKYMALIARLHRCDASTFPVVPRGSMAEAVAADVAMWQRVGHERGVMDEPLMALATRVLHDQMPAGDGPSALVHGDVGAGNFMCLDGEVTAMLDWELAHLGDPHEDLAWMWMRGAHTDFGDPMQRLAEYEAASAAAIDRDRLDWHLALVMWKSVLAVQARLRLVVPGELGAVQTIVRLTYDALLAAQLVRLLGGSLPLLTQQRQTTNAPEANLADELLTVADLAPDQRVIVEYLRDSAAQARWERESLEADCASLLGAQPADLAGHVTSCARTDLLAAAMVVGRIADRRALAMPRAVRRIERAKRIGLCT